MDARRELVRCPVKDFAADGALGYFQHRFRFRVCSREGEPLPTLESGGPSPPRLLGFAHESL